MILNPGDSRGIALVSILRRWGSERIQVDVLGSAVPFRGRLVLARESDMLIVEKEDFAKMGSARSAALDVKPRLQGMQSA